MYATAQSGAAFVFRAIRACPIDSPTHANTTRHMGRRQTARASAQAGAPAGAGGAVVSAAHSGGSLYFAGLQIAVKRLERGESRVRYVPIHEFRQPGVGNA